MFMALILTLSMVIFCPSIVAEGKVEATSKTKSEPNAGTSRTGPGEVERSNAYVHNWIKVPELKGKDLLSGKTVKTKSSDGTINVLVFMASWCEPCQAIAEELNRIKAAYGETNVEFLFIFTHDTIKDSTGFAKEHKMSGAIIGTKEILSMFKNPELPSIYVSDRKGWLTKSYIAAGKPDMPKLDEFLKILSAF